MRLVGHQLGLIGKPWVPVRDSPFTHKVVMTVESYLASMREPLGGNGSTSKNWMWCHIFIGSELKKQRQEDREFKVILGYTGS